MFRKKILVITVFAGVILSLLSSNLMAKDSFGVAVIGPSGATMPLVVIVVNSDLYPYIRSSFSQYVVDLQGRYAVQVKEWDLAGSTPQQLKDYLISKQADGLVGAFFVGDLPIAQFYHANDFYGYGVTFPCDLYYMNLNATWTDTDADGKFDTITGDANPQIWLGRLVAGNLPVMGSEEDIINNYFAKAHAYKTGAKQIEKRACSLIYKDWSASWGATMGNVYSGYETMVGDDFTATTYSSKLTEGHEYIFLCAHSSAGVHSFNDRLFSSAEIPEINPKVWFYNLFACSNCRYDRINYMGGCYVSTSDYGIVATGSTKTGSMLNFDHFTIPLGEGMTFGEAYKSWWLNAVGGSPSDTSISWFYGMTLLGDPTLIANVRLPYTFRVDDDYLGESNGNNNGIIEQGEVIELYPTLTNRASNDVYNVTLTASDDDPYLSLINGTVDYGHLGSGQTLEAASPLVLKVLSSTPYLHTLRLPFDISFEFESLDFTYGSEFRVCANRLIDIEPIVADLGIQSYPAIYEDKIVWLDYRNGNTDIYMYDLTTDEETQITVDSANQSSPAIYEDKIVWHDHRNGNWDIYAYDLTTDQETQITTDPASQYYPVIYEDKIVWQDYRNGNTDIYMYDLTTDQETQITTDPAGQYYPAIYKDKIVWQDDRNGNWDIYAYDLTVNKETQITTDPAGQYYPAIYKDKIVWQDFRNGNTDIYMYELTTDEETQITVDIASQKYPAIYEDKIVWQDYRNGDTDIYMYELTTGEETQITVDSASQNYPAICGEKIVWEDGRNGNQDIYMAKISYFPDPIAQTLDLSPGWNMFSLAVTPQGSQDMLDVLAPILDHVVYVWNEEGYSIRKDPVLGQWINNIGDWQATEGYWINVDQDVTLEVVGREIEKPLSVPLKAGVNMNTISYPYLNVRWDVLEVLKPLIDAGYLVKVQDEKGAAAEKNPVTGQWINNIGDMRPGEGYMLTVNTACTLKYTAPPTQAIELSAGWNIFSLAVTPQCSQGMLDILAPILDHVVMVQDEAGNRVERDSSGGWRNFIGDWEATEGYLIYVDQAVTLEVAGTEIAKPLSVPLHAGGSYVSYPYLNESRDALEVLKPLIDAGYLVKVMDEAGAAVETNPVTGQWINNIGDMKPGEGYHVRVTQACTLNYTAPPTQAIELSPGWNMFSLAVTPQGSQDMLDVLAPILDHVVYVWNEEGYSIRKDPVLGQWINSIGDWEATEGYWINVDQDVTLEVVGREIEKPLSVPLKAGVNMNTISYPYLNVRWDVLEVLRPLIEDGYLVKVQDEKGAAAEKNPVTGQWINNIGDMRPGEGYMLTVNTACTLEYTKPVTQTIEPWEGVAPVEATGTTVETASSPAESTPEESSPEESSLGLQTLSF